MSVNLEAYDKTKGKLNNYTASMAAYIVTGDVLNNIFGGISTQIDKAIYLPTQHASPWYRVWEHFGNSIKNHSMESMISALKEAGYK